MAGPAFDRAWMIVGVLAWQSLFYGFYLVASAGLWKQKKTHYSTYLMGGAALMNIVLNWWLVPKLASIGAAMATALSYLLLVVVSMALSERLWKVGFEKLVMTSQIAIGVAAVVWMSIDVERSWLTALSVHLLVVILLVSMLNTQAWVSLKKSR
jgi:O-antigen/teichoic acid export membrane protein